MQTQLGRRALVLAMLCAGVGASQAAAADDFLQEYRVPHAEWSVFAGATYTDNATLVANGRSDTIAIAGVGGGLYRDAGRLRADIDASAHYEDYVNGTYGGHVLGNVAGTVSYALVPDRLTWDLQDYMGQVTANSLLPTTPSNRLNVNTFSTGPALNIALGASTGLDVGLRYGQSNYESNPNAQVDNRVVSGNVGLIHRLSSATQVSVNTSLSRIEYRVSGAPSYDQEEFFGRYESRSARAGLMVDAGLTNVRESGSSVRDPLARVTLFRRLTPSWNVNLTGGTQFQNTATAIQSALGGSRVVNGQVVPGGPLGENGQPGGTVVDAILATSTFRSTYASAALDFVRPRTSMTLSGRLSRDRYAFAGNGYDRNTSGADLSFTRRLRPTMELHAGGGYAKREPLAFIPGDRSAYGDLGLDWRPGSLLSVTLSYHREQRSADTGGVGYLVNRVYLGFTFGPPKHARGFLAPGAGDLQRTAPRPGN